MSINWQILYSILLGWSWLVTLSVQYTHTIRLVSQPKGSWVTHPSWDLTSHFQATDTITATLTAEQRFCERTNKRTNEPTNQQSPSWMKIDTLIELSCGGLARRHFHACHSPFQQAPLPLFFTTVIPFSLRPSVCVSVSSGIHSNNTAWVLRMLLLQ